MKSDSFSLVPIEVILDRRLTLRQMRVLIALFSFRSKTTNVVWPSRSALAIRTGMDAASISMATGALTRLGWLEKDGQGGRSRASRYTLCVPEISTETVASNETVMDSITVTPAITVMGNATVSPMKGGNFRKKTVMGNATVMESITVMGNARGIEQTSKDSYVSSMQSLPDIAVNSAAPIRPATATAEKGKPKAATKVPECPQKAIIELFAERLPNLRKPRAWNAARAAALRQRWIDASVPSEWSDGYGTLEGGIDFWRSFFDAVARSTLAKGFTNGDRTWLPDLPWMLKAENFAKIVDGKYVQKRG